MKCSQCNNAVTRGKYCSNACKMKAYRNRNSIMQEPSSSWSSNSRADKVEFLGFTKMENANLLGTYSCAQKYFLNKLGIHPSFDTFLKLTEILMQRDEWKERDLAKENIPIMVYIDEFESYNCDEELILKYL